MIGIEELVNEYGISIPEDKSEAFYKAFHSNYKSIAEVEKKDAKISSLQTSLSKAEDTLKGFEGIDPSKYQEEISKLQTQLADAEKQYQTDIYNRDFEDALNKEVGKIKFTSSMAKQGVIRQLKEANLTLTDGKLYGFNDKLAEIRETDADAFVDETKNQLEESKVKFTDNMSSGGDTVSLDDYYKLEKGEARREFIRNNPSLFK